MLVKSGNANNNKVSCIVVDFNSNQYSFIIDDQSNPVSQPMLSKIAIFLQKMSTSYKLLSQRAMPVAWVSNNPSGTIVDTGYGMCGGVSFFPITLKSVKIATATQGGGLG